MESGPGDERPALRPTLASSWEAAGGTLARSLHLARADRGAADSDWEELLPPPAPGQDLVRLRSRRRGREDQPCCLYVSWAPEAAGEVLWVGVLSSARNMEVYVGDEYCGTGRGRRVGEDPDTRLEEKRVGSYLEQLLSKRLEHLEKRLTDYIDQRLRRLQEHVDHQLALLPALLRSPGSPPAGLLLGHYDSDAGERLSNGER